MSTYRYSRRYGPAKTQPLMEPIAAFPTYLFFPNRCRRAALHGDGWQPIGANTRFPVATPEQLSVAIKRLERYVARAGRPAGSVEVICRMHGYHLIDSNTASHDGRSVFSGSAGQIAEGIRRFEELGVSYLIASFLPVAMLADTADDMMRDMEKLANEVWPKV